MPTFLANDSTQLYYQDVGAADAPVLILLHGFTGSSAVWQRNVPDLARVYRVIAPDLRGHGDSASRSATGYHVARLAMDLKNLIDDLRLVQGNIRVVAGSLGCAILWSYAELFAASHFSHVVFVDQSPLQNYTSDGMWGPDRGNRSCNSAAALAHIQATLRYRPEDVYNGTISSCLAYLSHPRGDDNVSDATQTEDRDLFLCIAQRGDANWFGKLMADHTSLDWRDSIYQQFGFLGEAAGRPRCLVIASSRSGCFPPEGPLYVVKLINDGASAARKGAPEPSTPLAVGVTVDWGGHWCYWENAEKFNALVLGFLQEPIHKA